MATEGRRKRRDGVAMHNAIAFDGVKLTVGTTFRYARGTRETWEVIGVSPDKTFNTGIPIMPALKVRCVETGKVVVLQPEDYGLPGGLELDRDSIVNWPEPLPAPIKDKALTDLVVVLDDVLRLLGRALVRVELMRDCISYTAQKAVDETAKLAEEIREVLTASGRKP